VEALVGTGVLGLAALAAFLMVSMWRAFTLAIRPHARIVPLLALMTLAVRSFTGDTFESGGLYCLITLIFVMGLRDNFFARTWVPTPEEIEHAPGAVEAGSLVE
jgi:hypothetical protein